MSNGVVTASKLEALRTGFRLDFTKGLKLATSNYALLTEQVNSSTKIETYGDLGDFPLFREWIGEKRIKEIEERAYQLANRDFERTIGIHKNKIKDDNLGLIGPQVRGWGTAGGDLWDKLTFEALAAGHERECYDGQNFFDTEHPVGKDVASNMTGNDAVQPWYLLDLSQPLKPILLQKRQEPEMFMCVDPNDSHVIKTGQFILSAEARGAAGYTFWQMAHRCTGTLNAANFEAAKLAMKELTNDEGEPLGISPTHIVVGSSNHAAAKSLFVKANLANGESNINFGDVEIIEAKRLP